MEALILKYKTMGKIEREKLLGTYDDTGDDNTSLGPRDRLRKEGILPPKGKDLGKEAYKNRDYVDIEQIPAPEPDYENQGAEEGDFIFVEPKYALPRDPGKISTWRKKMTPEEIAQFSKTAKKQEGRTRFGRTRGIKVKNA